MIDITVISLDQTETLKIDPQLTLLDSLRKHGYTIYAPCGGKGTCGKCRIFIKGEGIVNSCRYTPKKEIEVILPGEDEANIIVNQTKYLEDFSLNCENLNNLSSSPYGVAIDLGTTTVVLYFLNLLSGEIEKIASHVNPQKVFGGDVISRINHCQNHENGLSEIQGSIIRLINNELESFRSQHNIPATDLAKILVVGNTTMLHFLLGEDPISIALAPFTPRFIDKQVRNGTSIGLNIHPDAKIVTIPGISAYVGADIVAGVSAVKDIHRNLLFIDIGTNGEIALITPETIYTCATAAGPAFEGANISCGMGAVTGAISSFQDIRHYQVLGDTKPTGICGSGIVDIIAYLLKNNIIDETGLLEESFNIHPENKIEITQQDVREIQLAKSAIYSGIKVLLSNSGLSFKDIDAVYLAGGFGNYINHESAIQIGLLPVELKDKIKAIGNSAGIGALQYLKSIDFENKANEVLKKSTYIELSYLDDFNLEFAMNMNFVQGHSII